LLDWLRETMLVDDKIPPADLDLLVVSDSPQEVCGLILEAMKEKA
jgi:hypothetical protein